ncbi:MAG: RidA family protein [Bryobacteraceae bacterium]
MPQKKAKEFLNPIGKGKPPGYTRVVTSPPGKMVFVSGTAGSDAEGKMPPDFSAQAKNTFENLGRCLAAAGAKWSDVVKINYFISDMANTAELRKVRANYLNMENPPAATLVQAGIGKGVLLEVELIAIVTE